MIKRRTFCLCLALLLLLPMVLTGCSNTVKRYTAPYKKNFSTERVADGIVAENDSFALKWEDTTQCALLYDKVNDKWYGTTPYDYHTDEAEKENYIGQYEMYNPLRIKYIETDTIKNVSSVDDADSLEGSVERDGFGSELIDNGVRLTYNFPKLEISVSVELLLNETGLEVRVPMNLIKEKSRPVYEIAVVPYFVSAANDAGGYVMVPSGSGALVEAKSLPDGETKYSEPVYGGDASQRTTMLKSSQNQVHLPVFGSSDNGKGMLGIIGNGAACARINVITGDSDVGYTAAYASFRIRGEENIVLTSTDSHDSSTTIYSQPVAGYKYLSVQYQPLQGDASYVDMANTYRNYLLADGYLKNRPDSVPALSVDFLGSTQVTESFFGIPYQSDVATTTLERTEAIAAELKELIGNEQLLVTLSGYGKGGLADTVVGGGFTLSNKVGNKKDWNSLLDFAKQNNTVLALDYNLTRFQKGSAGFGMKSSTAYTTSHLDAVRYTYGLQTGLDTETASKDGLVWYLLARGKVTEAVDKAIAAAQGLGLDAISFNSLSNTAYADYRAVRNTAKAQMDKDVAAELKKSAKAGLKVVSTKANAYAALQSDYITQTPSRSSQYNLFSEEIPFYALVFQGYKPLTSASINTAMNVRNAYLSAVATGATLQFTLCDTHHDALQFEQDTAYVSCRYSDWKADIAAMVAESADLHSKVGGQSIQAYEMENGLSKTVFENGITVYVNYTDAEIASPLGTVPAMGFVYG